LLDASLEQTAFNPKSGWRDKLLPAEVKTPEVDQGGLEKACPFSLRNQGFESIPSSGESGANLTFCGCENGAGLVGGQFQAQMPSGDLKKNGGHNDAPGSRRGDP
jgi:hypothetical protein